VTFQSNWRVWWHSRWDMSVRKKLSGVYIRPIGEGRSLVAPDYGKKPVVISDYRLERVTSRL
jgi:hypothetical protein